MADESLKDDLTGKHTAFASFEALCNSPGNYFPSLRTRSATCARQKQELGRKRADQPKPAAVAANFDAIPELEAAMKPSDDFVNFAQALIETDRRLASDIVESRLWAAARFDRYLQCHEPESLLDALGLAMPAAGAYAKVIKQAVKRYRAAQEQDP